MRDLQTGNQLYKGNPLDRGHLVRRLDPAWGDDHEEALSALADTFHYTNSAPQHHDFNAGELLWLGLEKYVLANADAHELRVTVFCGPVLDDEDREYNGVLIPRQYWKVLVVRHPEGGLSSTAYLLSQEKLVGGLEAAPDGWVYGQHMSFQKRVATIESSTDLDFGALRDVDAIDRPGIETAAREDVPLTSFADIVL